MVGEVTDKKNQISNNVLLVILGVLIILIVALIIGVVVHNTINSGSPLVGDNSQDGGGTNDGSGGNGGNNGENGGSGGNAANVNIAEKFSDTEDVDSFMAISSAIRDVYAETGDVDATIAKYEEAIKVAQDKGQQGMEFELYEANAEFMIQNGRCDDAMKYMNDKDLSGVSTQFLTRYYSTAVGMSIECKNVDEQASWQSKLDYNISLSNEGNGW